MVDESTQHQGDQEAEAEPEAQTEPERMSWFVFSFMSMCLFMTAVMAYYAWSLFQNSV